MINAVFPENNTFKPLYPKLQKTYVITYDGLEVISSNGDNKYLKCPEYAKRVYIIQDISLTAIQYGLSNDLIFVFNNKKESIEGKERILNLMKKPESDESKKLEKKLHATLLSVLNDEDYTLDDDIKDGFEIILRGQNI
jgi:hypothetical protein